MPRNPRNTRRQKQRPRRRLPPRPPPAAQAESSSAAAVTSASAGAATADEAAPARRVERETPYLVSEMSRVAIVSAVCFGLLAVLVAVDRLG